MLSVITSLAQLEAAEYAEHGPMAVTTLPGLVVEWSEVFAEPE